ncbi:non-ribosomal peptide synthetase [Luteolibacter sp. GHJ8]|uniref:Non-ribosomal peptide synthetase n=1 Tax=Luteolibacter rhizosphaerae TaxID=2989719 RepID=A0ABT3G293_9BACT|nr:non-ribosomal peptide synthetase [Luteolibacter rhizosphaerae]MCW1913956.1 non-ribosomal peptide synthetase [Luteolibacter rhizosphaerae]
MTAAPQQLEALLPDRLLAAFEARAVRNPDETAVIAGTRSISAGELEARANALAKKLQELGAGPGRYIGIGLDRSIELIVALLAVVKSGAAYVPLDPAYPAERLEHMIASAGLEIVISREDLGARFPAPQVLAISEEAKGDAAPVRSYATPDDPLYAIFTSGSTGKPKAAAVFRRGFANLLEWYAHELNLGASDRTLVISSPSFDLTQKNFFAPLLSGGVLVLDDYGTYDISRINGLIRQHGITLINCTPSAFYPLVETDATALISLRFAVLGGEPISIPRLRSWLESGAAEVVNTYGPTECTDICAFYRLHGRNLDAFGFVPLGHEIPNVTVTIRDEDLAIVPDGELGELCIGGAGLGGGYLNDPERTAKAFALAGGIYRSGDLARRLPCGTLEFRGRADHQVKVNGFRIELGEIELALASHESVVEAVVIAKDGRLTAHVQGAPADLKAHLATTLPAYMIPGEFIQRESFPLTPNGKIDRLALAAEERSTPETAISTDTWEGRVLQLWSEILGQAVSDPEANFFDLGGTSIHLAVVHVRLREMSGKDLAITDLFARPSAKSLAEFLSPQAAASSSAAQDRARLQQAGLARFRRPSPR